MNRLTSHWSRMQASGDVLARDIFHAQIGQLHAIILKGLHRPIHRSA